MKEAQLPLKLYIYIYLSEVALEHFHGQCCKIHIFIINTHLIAFIFVHVFIFNNERRGRAYRLPRLFIYDENR